MKKIPGVIIILLVLFSLTFCATKPEPVSDDEIKIAQQALERAQEAGAEEYAADLYAEASEAFDQALAVREEDPDNSRELLAAAKEKADEAYEATKTALYNEYDEKFREAKAKLDAIGASDIRPDETKELYDSADEALEAFTGDDVVGARSDANDTLARLEEYYNDTKQAVYNSYEERLASSKEKLDAVGASGSNPERTAELYNSADTVLAAMKNDKNFADAKTKADETLAAMEELYNSIVGDIYENYKGEFARWKERLEDIQAPRYRPGETADIYEQADKALEDLKGENVSDARTAADETLKKLERFYNDTLDVIFSTYMVQFRKYERNLEDIEAEKYKPEETEKLYSRVDNAVDQFRKGNLEEARRAADTLLADLEEFYSTLDENIRWATILKRDSEMYIDRADTVQAYIWAPEELELAVTQYGIGLDALRRYKLDAGIEALSLSKGYGQKAVRLAPQRKQEYQTESLQKEIEDELQEASEMTIITEEGRVIQPEERSRPEPDQQSLRVPLPATTAVLGDVSEMSLLDQARELYSLGVEAKEQGDYKQANEYFRQAGKLIHKYKSMSVGRTRVTTVYETNTLWFIAKYEWGNPALWPLIWEYNQGAIRDPDLIHPGDTVFIPAW